MTTEPDSLSVDPAAPTGQPEGQGAEPPPRRGRAGRIVEWFWGGAAMAALRAARPLPSEHTLELRRRAYAALALGRQALEPPQPSEHGPLDDLACQLFAQSIHWALLARRSWVNGATAETGESDVLARAAGGSESAAALMQSIDGKSFSDFAALPREEQSELARKLLPFAQEICEQIDPFGPETDRIWTRRLLRLGTVVVGVALLAWGGLQVAEKIETARDLAHGKPWVASSRYPTYGCTSPAQECDNSDIYFFSTNSEPNPWIEWDLGKPERVSGVRVDNRVDCCSERVVPLVVETSVDHTTWKEVARKKEDFTSWKGKFPPVQARWVRLKVPRTSLLHLVRVRILR